MFFIQLASEVQLLNLQKSDIVLRIAPHLPLTLQKMTKLTGVFFRHYKYLS